MQCVQPMMTMINESRQICNNSYHSIQVQHTQPAIAASQSYSQVDNKTSTLFTNSHRCIIYTLVSSYMTRLQLIQLDSHQLAISLELFVTCYVTSQLIAICSSFTIIFTLYCTCGYLLSSLHVQLQLLLHQTSQLARCIKQRSKLMRMLKLYLYSYSYQL